MSIGNVTVKNGVARVFDEKGRMTGQVSVGRGKVTTIGGTVAARKHGMTKLFNERGRMTGQNGY